MGTPVNGASYSTTTGVTGTTDTQGTYKYNKGDSVTFKVGDITLGSTAAASATITPVELAGTGTNARTIAGNINVLLQSLDADGNYTNGVTISQATATAAKSATLDFTKTESAFSADTTVNSLIASAASTGAKLVTSSVAQDNAKKAFFEKIQGVWESSRTTSSATVIRIGANGAYILADAGPTDSFGNSGIEVGSISWDPLTGNATATQTLDTNKSWGLSDGGLQLKMDGDKLVFVDTATKQSYPNTKVASVNTSIIGSWAFNNDISSQTVAMTFFDNGYYMLVDSTPASDCVTPGLEYGKYSLTGIQLRVNKSDVVYDTNGCGGLNDAMGDTQFQNLTFTLSGDGKSAVFAAPADNFSATLYRVQ